MLDKTGIQIHHDMMMYIYIATLSLFFFLPFLAIALPSYFRRLKRDQNLSRLEMFFAALSPLFWFFGNLIFQRGNKGVTNANVELALLGVLVGFFVVLLSQKLSRKFRASSIIIVGALASGLLQLFVPPFSHYNKISALIYVNKNSALPLEIKTAILDGKILKGMTAEQAKSSGGPYSWTTEKGELKRLTFNNLSQFDTIQPKAFSVGFKNNIVTDLRELNDLDVCNTEIKKWDSQDFKYAGFWREDCKDGFGLRFSPTTSGKYSMRFCGPGGCGNLLETPLDCTLLPSEPEYRVIDQDTMEIESLGRIQRYKRCRL